MDSKFILLIIGHGLSIFGDYAARTALTMFLLDKTGSAFDVSIMFIMNSLPAIIGISAGYFSNRFPLKHLLICYSILGALLSVIMCIVAGISVLFYGIYAVYFLLGLINSFYIPTRIAFISETIQKEKLRSFNSLDQTIEAVMMSAGIAAAAYLYINTGIQNVFIVNAISFLAIVLALFFMKSKKDISIPIVQKSENKATLKSTYATIRNNRELTFLTLGVGLSGIAVGTFSTMFIVFIRQDLNFTNEVYSHLSSVRALISSVFGLAFAFTWIKIKEKNMIIYGYMVMGIAIAFMSIFSKLELLFLWNIIIGAANTTYFIAVRTQLQKTVDQNFKTQIFALQSAIMRMCMVLFTGLSGLLADTFQVKSSIEIFIAGIIFSGIGLWGYIIYHPKMKKRKNYYQTEIEG